MKKFRTLFAIVAILAMIVPASAQAPTGAGLQPKAQRDSYVVLMAADGWAFYTGELGGHGSCLRRDMQITLFFAGPDLPHGAAIPHGRLVDLAPTVLGLLDQGHRLDTIGPIDGVNLADQLRNAAP